MMNEKREPRPMTTICRIPKIVVAFCCLFILHPSSLIIAQEVQWRHDYTAARREAVEKSRPLFLDFGTQNCFWCRKLDVTTFRDPTIVGILNDRFIPLKVQAE